MIEYYNIPPSIFNAYLICHRQAWLMLRNLQAEQENTFIELGRLINETTFKNKKKEIYIPMLNAIIDVIFKRHGVYVVAEIKKSSKKIESNIMQLKYYLYLFNKNGIKLEGVLKVPYEKKSIKILLSEEDIKFIESTLKEIEKLKEMVIPPPAKKINICSKCGHYNFCFA